LDSEHRHWKVTSVKQKRMIPVQENDGVVQNSITAFWDTIAAFYDNDPSNVPRQESPEYMAWARAIEAMLPEPPSDVLDIGTGTGFVALIAGQLGHRVVGVDLSEAMLTQAQTQAARSGIHIDFKLGDAVEPPVVDSSADVIISRHLLWTLRQPQVALANWRRILRPRGRIILIDGFWFLETRPEEEFGLFQMHYSDKIRNSLPAMKWQRVELVAELLRQAGFSEITTDNLADIRSKADNDTAEQPWYRVTGRRGE
jgi:ubiquinone/menaquinone biosynthesis C-methylase UbiE